MNFLFKGLTPLLSYENCDYCINMDLVKKAIKDSHSQEELTDLYFDCSFDNVLSGSFYVLAKVFDGKVIEILDVSNREASISLGVSMLNSENDIKGISYKKFMFVGTLMEYVL